MSELQKDIVSGDWIIMAPERGGRPFQFHKKRVSRRVISKKGCPFENLKATGNWPPIARYPKHGNWHIVLLPNKFPALMHDPLCAKSSMRGPYDVMEGIGHHNLVVTRDHYKNFANLSLPDAVRVLEMFQVYNDLVRKDKCLRYVSLFANWGSAAGASIYHPHYQLMALPIIPPDIEHSLKGSRIYFKRYKKCVHCAIIAYERKEKKRIIFENKNAVAFAPFVSRISYEIRIFPKSHLPYFEATNRVVMKDIAVLLQKVLRRMEMRLGNPDYNFFIHTSPMKEQKQFSYYHWHIEIFPKDIVAPPGGVELGTGVDINTILPEVVAKLLQ